jgi:hypothetical protein
MSKSYQWKAKSTQAMTHLLRTGERTVHAHGRFDKAPGVLEHFCSCLPALSS